MSDDAVRPDPLPVKLPGRGIRLAGRVLPGIGRVNRSIPVHTEWWSEHNATQPLGGPALVAIGDSTALGIGASHPDRGYVGRLAARTDADVATFNLAMSGARVRDALDRQLPQAARLLGGIGEALVTCGIGSNDVFWDRTDDLHDQLDQLLDALDDLDTPVVLLDIAGRSGTARRARRHLRAGAERLGFGMAPVWDWPMGGLGALASDRFHPNDRGYGHMVTKLAPEVHDRAPAIVPDPSAEASG